MDIYQGKKSGDRYIGVNVEQYTGNVIAQSTFISIHNGEVVCGDTSNFKYIGKIENGRFTSIEEVRKILLHP